jgi:hypothetical protein
MPQCLAKTGPVPGCIGQKEDRKMSVMVNFLYIEVSAFEYEICTTGKQVYAKRLQLQHW